MECLCFLQSRSQPIDDGQYIFTDEEKAAFLANEPKASELLRPYIGSQEFLNGGGRWIMVLDGVSPSKIKSMPAVAERVAAVRKFRSKSKRKQTLELANAPTRFCVTVLPTESFLVVPEVSSERREYVPIGWLEPPTVPSNLVRVILDADLWHFGILTSKMHMAWLRHIGGRLESRYRYSIGIVYNPFPWPANVSDEQRSEIRRLAQEVLDSRSKFGTETLSNLYDPDLMPVALRKAHMKLDDAVDRLYRKSGFETETQRVEFLFKMYETLASPLIPEISHAKRKKRKSALT